MADDGFGVALADRLARRELPPGVEVVDFGIRGMDLAYAMQDGYDVVVLLDASPRGGAAGHAVRHRARARRRRRRASTRTGWTRVKVLALARALGGPLPRTLVVGCEPATRMRGDEEDIVADISEPVRAALDEGVLLVESLLAELIEDQRQEEGPS